VRRRVNSSRVHLDAFVAQAAQRVSSGDFVLDAGAGHGPYRHHFAHARYESADFQQVEGKTYGQIDYVCDLARIPVEDDRFSLVLLNQVLEHLPEPGSVLAELRRVLKPDGEIWASTPLFYEEHDTPYDFYRYTQFGLRHLFERAGFRDVRIAWLEGYLGTVSYELDVAARAVGGGVKAPLRRALWLASGLAARADVRRKRTNIGHPKNYTIIATA
jgi:SAM-dependent methyltransferase